MVPPIFIRASLEPAREAIADPNDDLAWETVRDALHATPMR